MNEKISPNAAFCECCGNRINLSNGGQVVRFCALHRTAEARAKHVKDQAELVKERDLKLAPATV